MITRRDFVKQSALAGAGVMLSAPLLSFNGSQNEKVVIGVVGTNSRGLYLAKMFARLAGVEVGSAHSGWPRPMSCRRQSGWL